MEVRQSIVIILPFELRGSNNFHKHLLTRERQWRAPDAISIKFNLQIYEVKEMCLKASVAFDLFYIVSIVILSMRDNVQPIKELPCWRIIGISQS